MISEFKAFIRNNIYSWRFILNTKVSLKYLLHFNATKSIFDRNILSELAAKGIAFGSAKEILGDDLFNELFEEACKLRQNKKSKESDKEYARFYLDNEYEAESVWARVADNRKIKQIAMDYFKMKSPKLVYYDLWENIANSDEPKNAQLWHRDRDDLMILKIFIYLSDVDVSNGAFTYAPGTHIIGHNQKEPEYFLENGKTKRSYDAQLERIVPKENWIIGSGKMGTIVFADTHGLHKGGFVTTGSRFLYTCMFLSPYSGRMRFTNL